jgi:hypothetical protein
MKDPRDRMLEVVAQGKAAEKIKGEPVAGSVEFRFIFDGPKDEELQFTCMTCGETVAVSALQLHASMVHDTKAYHTDMVKRKA